MSPRPNPPECWDGWEACHHTNAKRHAGLLSLLGSLSTFPSTYKVQQSNSKMLGIEKQHSLALGVRLRFQSLREGRAKNKKSQQSITFSLCRFWGAQHFLLENQQDFSTDGLGDKADPLIVCFFSVVFKSYSNKHFPIGKSLLDSCKHCSQVIPIVYAHLRIIPHCLP